MKTLLVEIIRADKTEFRKILETEFQNMYKIADYKARDAKLLEISQESGPGIPDVSLTLDDGGDSSQLSWWNVLFP
jgi:hypothetical protein